MATGTSVGLWDWALRDLDPPRQNRLPTPKNSFKNNPRFLTFLEAKKSIPMQIWPRFLTPNALQNEPQNWQNANTVFATLSSGKKRFRGPKPSKI